jgi:hypothetical protein
MPDMWSDAFTQVAVKGRDGRQRLTQAYERERFTAHRLQVIGADGVDLKPQLDKQKQG